MEMSIRKRRVYQAESDPRQAKVDPFFELQRTLKIPPQAVNGALRYEGAGHYRVMPVGWDELAREFGPWVKSDDGSWFRDRSKRRRKR